VPPHIFYLCILLMCIAAESVFIACGRPSFGRLLWIVSAVVGWSYAALWLGYNLPTSQLWAHVAAFAIGIPIARGLASHICAGLFFPMLTIDALKVAGVIDPTTWWWAIFYLACAQLIAIGLGADFHPIGKAIRKMAEEMHCWFPCVMATL